MRVGCTQRCCLAVAAALRLSACVAGARAAAPAAGQQRSARRAEGRAARCRRGGAQHGAGREPAEAGGLLRSRRRRPATPTPPERDPNAPPNRRPRPRAPPADRRDPARPTGSSFANSDLAFSGNHIVHRQLPRLQHLRHRDAEEAEAARVGRLSRRPGRRVGPRQPAVHVGRADARPARLRHAGRRRRRSAPSASAASASSTSPTSSKPKQVAAVQTCRGSHTHTLVTDPKDTANLYVYGSGTEHGAIGRGARRLLGLEPEGGSEHRALQHRRDPGAARRAARRRRSSTGRASSPTRRPATIAGLWPGGDHGPGTQKTRVDQPVPRHHRLPGGRPRRRRLLGQRHPARHLAIRCTRCGSIRSSTRTSPTGTRRRSTTTAPR